MTNKNRVFDEKDLEKRLGPLTVGGFIRTWRTTEEMSLKEFGKLMGVSVANLCDIEKGRTGVSPGKAAQISKAIGVPEALLVRLAIEEGLRAVGLKYRVALEPAA
jgi:transcriptional regulator with XRE-family HTH domain